MQTDGYLYGFASTTVTPRSATLAQKKTVVHICSSRGSSCASSSGKHRCYMAQEIMQADDKLYEVAFTTVTPRSVTLAHKKTVMHICSSSSSSSGSASRSGKYRCCVARNNYAGVRQADRLARNQRHCAQKTESIHSLS
jgi:hypothetical protein